eukprot:12259193-Karenia_brevis.AAC.1
MSQLHSIMFRVYVTAQELKSSQAFLISHPDLSLPKFVHFTPPVYTSHMLCFPIKYKATGHMIDTYLAHAPPGVHGLRSILDHVKISAS